MPIDNNSYNEFAASLRITKNETVKNLEYWSTGTLYLLI